MACHYLYCFSLSNMIFLVVIIVQNYCRDSYLFYKQQDQGNRSGQRHSESKISIKTSNINVLKALLFNYEPNIDYMLQSKHSFISL